MIGRETFGGGSVCGFFALYYVLAAITAGSAISSGLVVPMLLIGACVGRMYGILCLGVLGQASDTLAEGRRCEARRRLHDAEGEGRRRSEAEEFCRLHATTATSIPACASSGRRVLRWRSRPPSPSR